MFTLKNNIVTVLCVFLLSALTVTAQRTDEVVKKLDVSPGEQLVMRVNPGDVTINTWDKNEFRLLAEGIDSENSRNLEVSRSNGKIRVEYSSDWGWSDDFEFEIYIPKKFNIDIQTSGGEIELVSDLEGDVRLNSAGGDIGVGNIIGDLEISTSGGDISTGNVKGDYSLTTMGGDIDGNEVNGKRVRVKTMGGDITIRKVNSRSDIQTYGGEITIGTLNGRCDLNTYGGSISINNILGDAELNTYGGSIDIGSSEVSLDAKTAGGNITIRKARGYLDAKTNAGNISVILIPEGHKTSKISSDNGSIDVQIPSGVKATIDAEIVVYGWGEVEDGFIGIDSDFKAESKSKNRNNSKLNALYQINGGGPRVELRAVNSGISITKVK